MIKVNGYSNYDGGKSGNGTYQTIINHIPPFDLWISLYLGNCGVTRFIKPAAHGILNDIDKKITDAWNSSDLPDNYIVLNRPALEILKELRPPLDTGKKAFIYLDPPYRLSSKKDPTPLYKFSMTDHEHIELLQQITKMKGFNIMISHYPDDIYDLYLHDWQKVDFYSTIRGGVALERLYMNYQLTDERHDYRFLGRDFRERERNNRIRRNLVKKINRMEPDLKNAIIQDLLATFCDTAGNDLPGYLAKNCDVTGTI